MKNCIKIVFFYKVRLSTPRPYYSCASFQFPVSAVYEFFPGDIFDFFLKQFSMSEFAGFNNIYMSLWKQNKNLQKLLLFR